MALSRVLHSAFDPMESLRAPVVLQARDLVKTYRMGEVEVTALRGVDLDLYEGELIVLLGASGSGKSTLLNILGGLDAATSGYVRYREHDLTIAEDALLTRYRREHVGFVFQFYNLIPSLTARENVALVSDIADDPMSPEEALDLVGLAPRMDHFPSELSGGEQQRVPSRAPSRSGPISCCATSLPARSTTGRGRSSSRSSIASTASSARRRRSSPTTRRSPAWPTASSCCRTA
jgi:putative ABC transport system ATP-binding protein